MYSLILPTYKNSNYLKLCINSILKNSYYKTHQICIHINGYDQESIDYLNNLNDLNKLHNENIKSIDYTISQDNIDLFKAVNICTRNAIFDKILIINDDQYFSKNWDYNLHKWEIELNNKFPYYTYIIGYRMCEPFFGSFPPICNAGKTVDTFDVNKFNDYVKEYSTHSTREEWLSNALYPKDILLKYTSDFKSKLCDIDFVMTMLKYFKDNNVKFLIFGINDCFVYHFGSIVTKRLLQENILEPNEVSKFENKWNMTIDNAYNKTLRNESIRSCKLVNEMLNKPKEIKKSKEINDSKKIKESKEKSKENETSKYPIISTYISTTNALFYQSTLEQTIRQSILFSDEIVVVNSINSSDGTQNLLNKLKEEYPNIIKLFIFKEDYTKKWNTITDKKTFALKQCTGDYCILQDDDECIHEKYINQIRQLPTQYPDALAFRFNTIHFYRSYNHYQDGKDWYQKKVYMVKNNSNISHGKVGTDLDNHIISIPSTSVNDNNQTVPLDSLSNKKVINTEVTSYHYGWANRNDAILLMKKHNQDELWHGKDYWETHKFPYKFDNSTTLPEFKETHPKYMIPIIEQEKKFNTKQIKEFEKDFEQITSEQEKSCEKSNKDKINEDNYIKISACIITRNESERIKDTIFHIYPYVDEIIINDASDDNTTKNLISINDFYYKIKYFKTEQTDNFAEERNKMHSWATGDYCLHIDTDERFDVEFLKNMKNIINKYLDKNIIPMMFRFPRKNVELDIKKDPDHQIRLLNRLYIEWIKNVHEIPIIKKNNEYIFHEKNMIPANLIFLDDYVIDHLPKDRISTRKRWDMISNINLNKKTKENVLKEINLKEINLKENDLKENDLNKIETRKLLICSMFKNSSKWINDVLKCIDYFIYYNNNIVSNKDKLLISLAFLGSKSNDDTIEILNKYIEELKLNQSNLDIWYENFENETDNISRYKKLAWLRNSIISKSTENIKLKDDDLVLFMDSDVKFDKNIVHELIIDMNKSNADIIAPLLCIEDNGVFKNNYFYDTLAFRNIDNEQFSHFKPYIFGNIKRSKIKKETHEKIKKTLEKIDELNILRKLNWEFNMNTPLNNEFPEKLYNEAYSLIDLNIPIKVNSVGSFYIMKYKVAKNVKYTGNNDSEQVEFMNSARLNGYKIFVSQRLKILHVNLEKYGLKWH